MQARIHSHMSSACFFGSPVRINERLRQELADAKRRIAELEAGKGKRFTSTDALMADLNADD